MKKILLLLTASFVFASQSGHAQQRERMIAQAYYLTQADSFYLSDSLTYIYIGSPLRDTANWGCDTMYRWHSGPTAQSFSFQSITQRLWTNGRELSDTTWYLDTVHHDYFYYYYATGSFDSTMTHTRGFSQSWDTAQKVWVNTQYILYTLNAAGDITEMFIVDWQSNAWDTVHIQTLTYNANNQLLTTTDSLHGGFQVSTYSYDQLGRLDTLASGSRQSINSMQTYSYNATGDTTIVLFQQQRGAGWYILDKRIYAYDSHHNNTGYIDLLPDTSGGWVNDRLYTTTFDSYDMITSSTQLQWDTSGIWIPGTGDQMRHYYYAPFTIPSGIADISIGDARIYPVPAADMLSLDLTWPDAQVSTAMIYDMTGRSYYSATLPCTASYHGYIPLHGLPAGLYTLHVEGANAAVSRTFNIVK